ncbi:MAG: PTS sugar transporter subunit IIA [Kofleriaceae bacterium]
MAKKQDDDALLTLHELAVYLHLDEGTVFKLVSAGKIPGIQLDRQWRFKRPAIDAWIADQLVGDDENFADVPDGMKQPLEDLLPDQAIIPNLRARDPLTVIEELAGRAYTNGWLHDKPWFIGAVVERESLSSTAMEGGVAFLHTRAKDKGKIARPFVVVGRSWEGINFGAPDGNPTYLFFLLGLKYDKLHLPILGRLARALRNPATIARLRALSSTEQMRALLLKEDATVRAGLMPELAPADFKPKLDKTLRLRAIRRLQHVQQVAQKKADAASAAEAKAARARAPRTVKAAGTTATKAAPKAKAAAKAKPAAGAKAKPPRAK